MPILRQTKSTTKKTDAVPSEGKMVLTGNYQIQLPSSSNPVSIGPMYPNLNGDAFVFDVQNFPTPSQLSIIKSIEINVLHIRNTVGEEDMRLFLWFPDSGKYLILATGSDSPDTTFSSILNIGMNISTLATRFDFVVEGGFSQTMNISMSVNNFEIQPYNVSGNWKEAL